MLLESAAGEETYAEIDALLGNGTAAALRAVFLADLPGRLARMRQQAMAAAADALRREAHALAGSAALLGLHSLVEAARVLECSPPPPPDEIAKRFAALERLLLDLLDGSAAAATPRCVTGKDGGASVLVSSRLAD